MWHIIAARHCIRSVRLVNTRACLLPVRSPCPIPSVGIPDGAIYTVFGAGTGVVGRKILCRRTAASANPAIASLLASVPTFIIAFYLLFSVK